MEEHETLLWYHPTTYEVSQDIDWDPDRTCADGKRNQYTILRQKGRYRLYVSANRLYTGTLKACKAFAEKMDTESHEETCDCPPCENQKVDWVAEGMVVPNETEGL
jgi:hypothetical protein